MHHHRRPKADPWRTGDAAKQGVLAKAFCGAVLQQLGNLAGRLGVGNDRGKLGRQRHQERLFAFVEAALLALLHH